MKRLCDDVAAAVEVQHFAQALGKHAFRTRIAIHRTIDPLLTQKAVPLPKNQGAF